MDVLMESNFEDALHLEEKQEEISEKDWDKMNRTACGIISLVQHKISSIT